MIAALVLFCCLSAPADVTVDAETLTMGALIPFPSGDTRAAIGLGYAPQPGLARRFLRQELLAKIATSGSSTTDLSLPESILVRRKAERLSGDLVRAVIQEAFARQYPNAEVTVISVDVPEIQVTSGSLVDLSATIPARADVSGPLYVRLDVKAPGNSRSVYLRTVAEVRQQQLVLKNAVAANTSIRREDIEWQVLPLRGVNTKVPSLENLEGLLAVRDLRPGQAVTSDLFYSPLLVKKGDSVTVKATAGGITVAATMRAKSDARFGETISVEHLSGKGITSARVIGARTLEALQGAK